MEEGGESPVSKNVSPMITNEAITSAAESPALQRGLELLRSARNKGYLLYFFFYIEISLYTPLVP